MRGILASAAIKAPGFGDRRKDMLEDIAALTGGTVVSPEKGMRLDRFNPEWLGSARKVVVGRDTTTIVDGKGSGVAIDMRVGEIKNLIDAAASPYEKEQLQDRLGRLIGGVAIVHVGGHTELEMKEKKDRVEDALHATRAALEEGILPGGGIALLRAAEIIFTNLPFDDEISDRTKGQAILAHALEQPFTSILANSGLEVDDIEAIMDEMSSRDSFWLGFNPLTDEKVDMFEAGIIDPAKVTRLALENAASVAGTMLITECVVAKVPEEKSPEEPDYSQFM
jgi:chaperonin GroEL